MTVFPTLFKTSPREIRTLFCMPYTSSLKKILFQVKPSRLVHSRKYSFEVGGGGGGGVASFLSGEALVTFANQVSRFTAFASQGNYKGRSPHFGNQNNIFIPFVSHYMGTTRLTQLVVLEYPDYCELNTLISTTKSTGDLLQRSSVQIPPRFLFDLSKPNFLHRASKPAEL